MAGGNQNIATPWAFIHAVEKYFKIKFKYDMAALKCNAKAPKYFTRKNDSLSAVDWPRYGWLWLNPTFINLTKWINKCNEQKNRGSKIISIWPLSGDKNQIVTYENAEVYIVHGRVWPEVRGCMVCKWDLDSFLMPMVYGLTWDGKALTDRW